MKGTYIKTAARASALVDGAPDSDIGLDGGRISCIVSGVVLGVRGFVQVTREPAGTVLYEAGGQEVQGHCAKRCAPRKRVV